MGGINNILYNRFAMKGGWLSMEFMVMPVEAKTEGACDTINVCGIVF